MNDQVILSVTKRGGGLEVTTRGTGHDQLAAIEAVAASAWRVMTANRNVPPDAATGRGHRRDPAFRAARDPDCCRQKRAHEHGGDRVGPEREVRRNHEREKEPAAGHSPGDGADRL